MLLRKESAGICFAVRFGTGRWIHTAELPGFANRVTIVPRSEISNQARTHCVRIFSCCRQSANALLAGRFCLPNSQACSPRVACPECYTSTYHTSTRFEISTRIREGDRVRRLSFAPQLSAYICNGGDRTQSRNTPHLRMRA